LKSTYRGRPGITREDDSLHRRSQAKIAVRADARPGPFRVSWGEFAVFSGYAVVLLALSAWSFIRDA